MQSFGKAGYKNKISQFVVDCLGDDSKEESIDLGAIGALEKKYAIALQSAWRSRAAREYVSALKQEKNCISHRNAFPEVLPDGAHIIPSCVTCHRGDQDAELKQKIDRIKFKEVEKLLFSGHQKVTISDSGDNWNQRYQRIMSLSESTAIDRASKYSQLSTLNNDFVTTAKTYAQTIISEYFLHTKDKSIRAKNLGGIAGGQKYLWRGILFKMSDGSTGPYNGSDEAAAKAAGHDLKGAMHYRTCGVNDLHLPLMALIDYKGFRMTAQAYLPLGKNSLVYGSADGGKTVLKSNEGFNKVMESAASELNLCGHVVGRVGGLQNLHAAVDIEGHIGMDNRFYLLDMSRSFPPECPTVTKHLDDILGDGTIVLIKLEDPKTHSFTYTKGTVHRAYPHGKCYDILFEDGSIAWRFPADLVQRKNLSIFWRLLRPEYVKSRGTRLVPLTLADIARPDVVHQQVPATQAFGGGHDEEKYMEYMQNVASKYQEQSMDEIASPSEPGYDSFDDDTKSGESAAYDEFDVDDEPKSGGGINDEGEDATYDNFDDDETPKSSTVDGKEADAPGRVISSTCAYTECEMATASYGAFGSNDDGSVASRSSDSSDRISTQRTSTTDIFAEGGPQLSVYGEFGQYDAVVKSRTEKYEEESPPHSDDEVESDSGYDHSAHQHFHQKESASHSRLKMLADPSLPPCPLSPDALSAFSNFDPAAVDRNREVIRATERLVQEVIPALAHDLEKMTPFQICNINFSVYFHSHGVNMRHMGIVRSLIPPNSTSSHVRTALLLQIVARTIKNIARDYQRRWMKSEQSTSEQGMHIILIELLNLVVGCNGNSESFWTDKVVVGVIQRFGACSLDNDISHIYQLRRRPQFLKTLVVNILDMIGLRLKSKVIKEFLKEPSPFQFEFILQDVAYLEPKVKCMHIVDFGTGIMLQELAENREKQGGDLRTVRRLRSLATEHFVGAEKALPNHSPTKEKKNKMFQIQQELRREN